MKLAKQVITLEQAKKLKELGIGYNSDHHVPYARKYQQAIFYWYEDWKVFDTPGKEESIWQLSIKGDEDNDFSTPNYLDSYYAAFTVAELGVMLPWENINGAKPYDMMESIATIGIGPKGFYLIDRNADGDAPLFYPDEDVWPDDEFMSEAQARAALLIHLLESGKVSASEVNARLLTS